MAEIKVSCVQCGQHVQCDEGFSGRQINCPSCQQPFVVPQILAKPGLKMAHAHEKTYLVTSNGSQCGPYTIEQLKSYLEAGQLSWEDLAWCEGMNDWKPLNGIIMPSGVLRAPMPLSSPAATRKTAGKKVRAAWWIVSSHVISSLIFMPLAIGILLGAVLTVTAMFFNMDMKWLGNFCANYPALVKMVTLIFGLGVIIFSTNYSFAYLKAKTTTQNWSVCIMPSIVTAVILYLGCYFLGIALVSGNKDGVEQFTANTILPFFAQLIAFSLITRSEFLALDK